MKRGLSRFRHYPLTRVLGYFSVCIGAVFRHYPLTRVLGFLGLHLRPFRCRPRNPNTRVVFATVFLLFLFIFGGGRVVRWCWVSFQCRGVLLIWISVGQGPTALAVGTGGGVWTFFLSSIISLFMPPLSRRRPDID